MNPNANLRMVMAYGGLLLLFAIFVYWMSRPTVSQLPLPRQLTENRLDTNRQLVLVWADSLERALTDIEHTTPDVLAWEQEGNVLHIWAKHPDDPSHFDDLILGAYPLSKFAELDDSGLYVDTKGYGVKLPTQPKNNRRAVRLPAHILQSIHRNRYQK